MGDWLLTNFNMIDVERSGGLDSSQLLQLIKLTYVPKGDHLDKLMKWFHVDLETNHVTKEAFMDAFYKLQEDLSFVLSPGIGNAPSPRSPLTRDKMNNMSLE